MDRVSSFAPVSSNGAATKVSPEELYHLHEAECYEKAALAYRKAAVCAIGGIPLAENEETEIAR